MSAVTLAPMRSYRLQTALLHLSPLIVNVFLRLISHGVQMVCSEPPAVRGGEPQCSPGGGGGR